MPIPAASMERPVRMESRQPSRFAGQRIHLIGVSGSGMSGLASILLDAGALVTGSDPKLSPQALELIRRGARITREQTGQLLSEQVDLVVRTAAVPDWNPEYRKAVQLGLPTLKYAQLLGLVMQERLGIAVSGTHGKSTTTAMISFALVRCGADPSFVIGGTVPQLGGSSRSGSGPAFVVEACEFDRSFHNYQPQIAVITNIEADHLDCYAGGIVEIVESFRVFASQVPPDGLIIANGQDKRVRQALSGLGRPIEWVGLEDPCRLDWSAQVLTAKHGQYAAEIRYRNQQVAQIRLAIPGRHNVFNATAALAACRAAGIDPGRAGGAISIFAGVDRRMSEVGHFNQAIVVDDYGHHPTEIRTTLRALREKYEPKRLICVFQPHQHSRTRYLLDDFASSFSDADLTILPDIYAARDAEADRNSIRATDLLERIVSSGQRAIHLPELGQIVQFLREEVRPGDLVVTMGAGNVGEVGVQLTRG